VHRESLDVRPGRADLLLNERVNVVRIVQQEGRIDLAVERSLGRVAAKMTTAGNDRGAASEVADALLSILFSHGVGPLLEAGPNAAR